MSGRSVVRYERRIVMSSLIDKWTAEHRNFEKLIEVLTQELRVFQQGGDPNYELMLDVVYYMIHYPDLAHHPAEDIVFSRVAERAPRVSLLIDDLHQEHQRIADAGQRLQEQLEAVLTGAVLRRAEVEQSALRYIEYLRHNMQIEEKSLFPLVRRVLGEADWAWINARLPKRADPLFGDRAEERYRGLHAQIASGARCGCAVA
jgi:hemerythrin-like domain-containing protein